MLASWEHLHTVWAQVAFLANVWRERERRLRVAEGKPTLPSLVLMKEEEASKSDKPKRRLDPLKRKAAYGRVKDAWSGQGDQEVVKRTANRCP